MQQDYTRLAVVGIELPDSQAAAVMLVEWLVPGELQEVVLHPPIYYRMPHLRCGQPLQMLDLLLCAYLLAVFR